MALPSMPYNPVVSGYSFEDAAADTLATQLDGGAPLWRSNVEGNAITANVEWKLYNAEVAAFHTFYKVTLCNGALPFSVSLIIDDDEPTALKAHFFPNSLQVKWLSDKIQSATATLEVVPDVYDVAWGQVIIALFNELGSTWESTFPNIENDLDQIVNVDLPGIGL